MENKIFTLLVFSLFTVALLGGLASATHSTVLSVGNLSSPTSVDVSAGSFTFTFDTTYTGGSSSMDISFGASTVNVGTLSIPTEVGMNGTANELRTVTGTITNFSSGLVGSTIDVVINATTTGASIDDHTTFSVLLTSIIPTEVLSCNAKENPGFLKIKDIDFDNKGVESAHSSFGSDDEWFPLEEIEVEIEIENDGSFDIDDIEVEWGLWDIDRGEWAIDLDDEKDFNLKDGKDELLTISFVVDDDMDLDLDQLSDRTDNYRFYVIATGVIDDSDSPNNGEDTCVSGFDSTTIIIENDFVVLDNIEFPEVVSCGDTVTVTADVWNIGESDQDEVSVFVSSKDLDLNKDIIVGDIDEFDNAELSFTFRVPNNIEEKTYTLLFEVFDEDNDVYENDLDDDESEFFVPFKVGDCSKDVVKAVVSASLVSEAKAGQSLVVRTTVTNPTSETATYTVNGAGFALWADSVSVDTPTFTLEPGASREVLMTFEVVKDAKGTQTFFVEVVSDSDVTRQPVSVDIEPRSLFGFTGASILGGSNAYLWGLGLLNIILVVVIILVAVRIARR